MLSDSRTATRSGLPRSRYAIRTLSSLACWMTTGTAVALEAGGSALASGAPASPKTQLPLPSASFSSRTATSLSSNERMSTGPEISDHRPIRSDRRPTSTICGCEPHSAFPSRTRSATTTTAGSTSSWNVPSIANGRPTACVTKASMRPLWRLRSPNAR